jgi:hypothetical protein
MLELKKLLKALENCVRDFCDGKNEIIWKYSISKICR